MTRMDNRIFARLNGDREIQIDEQFDLQSVLWFKLGSEDYAIKVDSVQTVLDEFSLTPVPNTPKFVKGVINLRGVIVPVVDLKELFQMPLDDVETEMIVVLELDNMKVGIAVDRVMEVLAVDFSALQPPPPSLSGLGAEYVTGLCKHEALVLITVDIVKAINIAKEMLGKYS